MKSLFPIGLLGVALLAGCNDSDNPGPEVTIDNEPSASGSHLVSLGDEANPTIGRYYQSADGSRMLIVNDTEERASAVYQRDVSGGWRRMPAANQDVRLNLLNNVAMALPAASFSGLANSYTATVQGSVLAFNLSAEGKISAPSGVTCQLAGQLSDKDFAPGVRKLSLSTSNCSSLPAKLDGVAIVDADYAPAKLRLVLDNGTQLTEIWAYAE